MARRAKTEKKPPISEDTVRARTGKGWKEWFSILDRAGARNLSHREIVPKLQRYEIGPWWQQMVTVTYEQARGLREKHETRGGFSVSASKTLGVPLSELYAAWMTTRARARWLEDPAFTVRKATAKKSVRAMWPDGTTSLEVNFYAKGKARSQVVVQHSKLRDAREARRMKSYWSKSLEKLKVDLEA